jgi:uncharacterized surface anchored protein
MVSEAPLAGAHIRIQGYFTEGNTNGMPIDLIQVTGSDGKAVFENLPAGQYTISEVEAPAGYQLDHAQFRSISLTWGQTAGTAFYNKPKTFVEVIKVDGDTGGLLNGAIFRLSDPTSGEIWEGTTSGGRVRLGEGGGSFGNQLVEGKLYILTEIQAPNGYVLDPSPIEVIVAADNQLNTITVRNFKNPSLTITKRDRETGQPLAGAVFTVIYENGQSVSGSPFTTDANGQIVLSQTLLEGNGERTLIVTETEAPPGYVLSDPSWQRVTMRRGEDNVVTFENLKKPTLTVIKYDELTNEPLAGASFRLWRTEGETWSENQINGADGRIVWTDLESGIYSVQEIDEPYGYLRDPDRKEILLEGGDNKTLEFFNRPRPVLTIFKRDAVTGEPLPGVTFRVQQLEGLTVGEFITDGNGMVELSPRTGYLLEERIYRVTEITPPAPYLLDAGPVKDALLKWHEPTELVFENLKKPTLIFIKRDGMSGRGISGATYRVQYETPTGGVITLGSYVTKCGLIVLPYVTPGWYVLTETIPATGYQLPTNPTQRMYLAPGQNSYTYAQTQSGLYADPRTNPNSGSCGMCGDWCGHLCSVLCAGNCGNPGDGTTSPGNSNGGFGNITITNGNGDPLGSGTSNPSNPPGTNPSNPAAPTLTAGSVTRNSDLTATVQFTSSAAGRYYYSVVAAGAAEPAIATGSVGTACSAGLNTVTVYMTADARDVYIKVKDADGNVSGALKIAVPAYSAQTQATAPEETPPDFSNMVITGGTVVYLNPDFPGITITFGNQLNSERGFLAMRKRITSLLLMAVMLFGTLIAPVPASASTGGAENYPLNSIVIKIEDIVTHRMLGGARFEIYFNNSAVSGDYGTLVATVDSDSSGVIVISGLPSGYYIVRQTMPPGNYQLSINNEQNAYIKPDGTSIVELVFSNYRYGGLVTLLTDKDTGQGVAGATFSVTDVNNAAVGHMADGIYTTDSRGEFCLANLPAGDYKITQLTAAQGYAMDSVPNVRTVRLQHTSSDRGVFMAAFENSPLGTLFVRLKDSVSKAPIQGAVFNVKLSGGADLGEYVTNADGSFTLPRIARGTYIISQVYATAGYLTASGSKTQYVNYVDTFAVDFENRPQSGLYVTKYDKDTKTPLRDAKFYVYQGNMLLGSYTMGADGVFHIPNLDPGWYTVVEHQAPYGYILDKTPRAFR